jgi:hypothetical protein
MKREQQKVTSDYEIHTTVNVRNRDERNFSLF